ncbi:MAG: dihydrodipicolinate synthase family protein [Bryobacteraceae bacterium]|jgi:dihydrodipicolinate synthase/N-acetylneuraminate lyase
MTQLSSRFYAALVVPFDRNGKVDEAAYRDLIQYFLQDRFRLVGGLIANPEAGEIYYLTREEKRRIAEIAVREASGKMPVFAGVFDLTTEGCVTCALDMKQTGADGLFLLPPAGCMDLVTMWNAEKYPEYWLDQIRAIDSASNLPIITHPVATSTPQWGLGVSGETARLICREIPNVIGWKMTYNYEGQKKMWKILRSLDHHVSILAAGGQLFHEFLAHDVLDGTASGSWNYGLEPMLDHIDAWRADDIRRARRIWIEGGLRDLHEYIYADYSRLHLRYKVAAWLRGLLPSCRTRPPMPVAKPEEIDTLSRLLAAAQIPVIQAATAS